MLAVYMQKLFFLPIFSFASLNSSYALLILLPPTQPVSVFLPSSCPCFWILCPFVLCLNSAGSSPFICAGLAGCLQSGMNCFCALIRLTLNFSQLGPFALPGSFPWDPSKQVPAEAEIFALHSRTAIPWILLISFGYLEHLDFL